VSAKDTVIGAAKQIVAEIVGDGRLAEEGAGQAHGSGASERLFAVAVDDGVMASTLAEFLHDRHPRTAHPPMPTRLA
jgi:hypothetical protein